MNIDQYVADLIFNKIETEDSCVYWRECVLRPDMQHGEQGYIIVWPDGTRLHTYQYPPNWVGQK